MPSRAVRLGEVFRRQAVPAERVFPRGRWSDMIRIAAARPDAARFTLRPEEEMIEHQSLGNRTVHPLIGEPVRWFRATTSTADSESPIAVAVHGSLPHVTPCLGSHLIVSLEALRGWPARLYLDRCIHIQITSSHDSVVMGRTPALAVSRKLAGGDRAKIRTHKGILSRMRTHLRAIIAPMDWARENG